MLRDFLMGKLFSLLMKYASRIRHTLVCLAQATALSIVALSDNVSTALMGVMLASMASGLGECTFLALASHYKK